MSRSFPRGAAVTLQTLTEDLHHQAALLREAEPVSWLPALNGWFVTGYDLALEVLRNPSLFTVEDERFTTGQVVGPSMLSTDGDTHRHHRSPFEPAFRSTEVGATGAATAEMVDDLIVALRPDGEAELREGLAAPLAVGVICRFLGLDRAPSATSLNHSPVTEALLGWYRSIVDAVTGLTGGTPIPQEARVAVEQLGRLVDEASQADRGVLPEIADGQQLTRHEVRSNTAVVLFGAIETCEAMTANALYHVLSRPPIRTALATQELDIVRVVAESLRLEPAAAVVDRYTTTDTTLGGVQIPARELVTVSLAGANRDPAHFANPDSFNPGRPGVGRHLSFARGPHVCLGLHLARLQTQVALQRLFALIPNAEPTSLPLPAPRGLIFRKPERVPIRW